MTRTLRFLTLLGLIVGFLNSAIAPQQITAASLRQRITPQNIHLLKEISRLGAPTPTGLTWSPNDYILAVSTSADIRFYNTREPESAPTIIPSQGGERINFN